MQLTPAASPPGYAQNFWIGLNPGRPGTGVPFYIIG